MKGLKNTKMEIKPKRGMIQRKRNANLILNTNSCSKDNVPEPLIVTPRVGFQQQTNNEELLKRLLDLEESVIEKEKNTFNRVSDLQKQVNWLTSTVYNLVESNETSNVNREINSESKSEKVAYDLSIVSNPPGLPIPKSEILKQDLKHLISPEPSPNSKNSEFILNDAEIDMINGKLKTKNGTKIDVPNVKRNVITPIKECFTPDSCDSPYVNKEHMFSPNHSR